MGEQSLNPHFTGQTAELEELGEAEYLHRAEVLVLREISQSARMQVKSWAP